MTESDVWWGMWVEMVVHPALGCSTWNITWHCSVKQNLKSQIRSDLKSQIGLCRSGSNSNSNKHPYLLRNVWQSERVLAIHNTKNRIDTPNVFAHQAEPSRFWHHSQSLCMTLRSSRWKASVKRRAYSILNLETWKVQSQRQGHSLYTFRLRQPKEPPTWLKLSLQ